MTGDMDSWSRPARLQQVEGTDLFFLKTTFQSDARLDYKFIVNNEYILDPLNPRTVEGGWGENSELRMPEFLATDDYLQHDSVEIGRVLPLLHQSGLLGYAHDILLYFPSMYYADTARYPTVYFHDGSDYVDFAGALFTLDNLIAAGDIEPTIGVFIIPPSDSAINRSTEYGMNHTYADYLSTELVPYIDSLFRTRQSATARLVIGVSFGGLAALHASFLHPDVFANAASQSGYVSFQGDTLIRMFEHSELKPIAVYLDVGTYETRIGGSSSSESNFHAGNRKLSTILDRKRYQHVYRELHDGHSWGNWRNELPRILHLFFKRDRQ